MKTNKTQKKKIKLLITNPPHNKSIKLSSSSEKIEKDFSYKRKDKDNVHIYN